MSKTHSTCVIVSCCMATEAQLNIAQLVMLRMAVTVQDLSRLVWLSLVECMQSVLVLLSCLQPLCVHAVLHSRLSVFGPGMHQVTLKQCLSKLCSSKISLTSMMLS